MGTYMTKDMKRVLTDISGLEEVLVVPISGRKTEDVRDRIGIKDIVYSGNHGLEMNLNGNGMSYNLDDEELSKLRTCIKKIINELQEKKLGKEVEATLKTKTQL